MNVTRLAAGLGAFALAGSAVFAQQPTPNQRTQGQDRPVPASNTARPTGLDSATTGQLNRDRALETAQELLKMGARDHLSGKKNDL